MLVAAMVAAVVSAVAEVVLQLASNVNLLASPQTAVLGASVATAKGMV
jgi:hypothetical protein